MTAISQAGSNLPSVPVRLADGKTYRLCVDLGALEEAEQYFREHDRPEINLIEALAIADLDHLVDVFLCAVHTFHPEIGFKDVGRLLTIGNVHSVIAAINAAWPEMSAEMEAANDHLCCDLDAIADAAEHFAKLGDGVRLTNFLKKLSLATIRSIFPCALHKFRPELTYSGAQKLMSLRSVYAVGMGVSGAWQAASPVEREQFCLVMAGQRYWTDVAHA